jgi:hypothetical protein
MKKQPSLNWLIPLVGLLALVAALAGLFWPGVGMPHPFTTLHGQTVQLYGQGLYRNDTILAAAGFKGGDVVTICIALPILIVSFWLYQRGSLRGGLLLTSILTYFLYVGATATFAIEFNSMFLVYVALLSVSLFAFIRAITSLDMRALAEQVAPRLPQRGVATFMFVAGFGTFFLWMSEVVGPLLTGTVPTNLGPYTTMYTHGFDSAVITPAAVLTGVLVLQRRPVGYLLTAPLLVLCTIIGITVIGQTISQTLAGLVFPIGVYIGMIGSWIVMGAFAVWLAIMFFRSVSEAMAEPLRIVQTT